MYKLTTIVITMSLIMTTQAQAKFIPEPTAPPVITQSSGTR